MSNPNGVFLHRADFPDVLARLAVLFDGRDDGQAGYVPTDLGAWVDLDALAATLQADYEVEIHGPGR